MENARDCTLGARKGRLDQILRIIWYIFQKLHSHNEWGAKPTKFQTIHEIPLKKRHLSFFSLSLSLSSTISLFHSSVNFSLLSFLHTEAQFGVTHFFEIPLLKRGLSVWAWHGRNASNLEPVSLSLSVPVTPMASLCATMSMVKVPCQFFPCKHRKTHTSLVLECIEEPFSYLGQTMDVPSFWSGKVAVTKALV